VLHEIWEDLNGLALTWQAQPYRRPTNWWVEREKARPSTTVDGHVGHVGLPTRRALDLLELANRDGGWPAGWDIGRMAQHCYATFGHLPDSWSHMLPKLLDSDFHMGFTSLIRWSAHRPARVITGAALDLVLHPWEPRTITHREAARVMGFPDDWKILPLRGVSNLRATWGKGITVQCGRWIGEQVRHALDGAPGENRGKPYGEREWLVKNR
jgi:site-specific DNA-cytosine methylase